MIVYYLSNAPTPYKISFWESLGSFCDLTVLLEVDHSLERDSSWRSEDRNNYTEIVMPHLFRKATGALCPAVKGYLRRRNGIIIINGYKSNDYIKLCLGMQSPNQVLAGYLTVM